jgi:hypothetical protein
LCCSECGLDFLPGEKIVREAYDSQKPTEKTRFKRPFNYHHVKCFNRSKLIDDVLRELERG